jgi:hypothetical protein
LPYETLLSCKTAYDRFQGIAQLEHWISGETTSSPYHGPAYFNTRLDWQNAGASQNAKLTICLRALLVPMNPVPNNWMKQHVFSVTTGVGYRLLPWEPLDFQRFKAEVKRQADSFWGNKDVSWGNPGLCLVSPADCEELYWPPGRPTHRLNADCDFELVFANGIDDAHVIVDCAVVERNNPAKDVSQPSPHMPSGGWRGAGRGFLALHHRDPWSKSVYLRDPSTPFTRELQMVHYATS